MPQKKSEVSTDDIFFMLEKEENILKDWDKLSQYMNAEPFHRYLYSLISEKNVTIGEVGTKALLSRSFSYQIFSGSRIPGRDIIIRIALVLKISLDETQRLLKLADRGALYPKVKRDAIIIYAINNSLELVHTEETLINLGQRSILE